MKSNELDRARRDFAERIRESSGLGSSSLVRAFATVPRERFVGPGPWKIMRLPDVLRYQMTPDDDPRRIYDNVLVALDADHYLNNGEPASLARWLDALDLQPGVRFLHVGCGVGYYTAVAAVAVSPGIVVGLEIHPELSERARRNLDAYENVRVVCGDGSEYEDEPFDAVFANAGVTQPASTWLDGLADGGRLLVPFTVALPDMAVGAGHMLRVVRRAGGYSARFVSPVAIFHCAGARTDGGNDRLKCAYQRGGQQQVRSLRRDRHRTSSRCWLHADGFCLSLDDVPGGSA